MKTIKLRRTTWRPTQHVHKFGNSICKLWQSICKLWNCQQLRKCTHLIRLAHHRSNPANVDEHESVGLLIVEDIGRLEVSVLLLAVPAFPAY